MAVAHPRQEELLAALPVELRDQSADLSDVGSTEYAFPAACLEQVFRILFAAGFVILGGDLWRKTEYRFEPAFQGWYVEGAGDDPEADWSQFLRVIPDGVEYFVTFVVQ
ncbi:hypothetical protein ACFYY8_11775 [Streptosporangium sp. NPDC001559]|uniref:hypothetical protein n=1 Tax=Streptosporangium sp. NPDC001559 TaxID=3366187 RepID=UPI0036E17D06